MARLRQRLDERSGLETVAVVEDLDIKYLRRLHSGGLSLFYGIGLPPQSIILLDCKRGFLIEENQRNVESQLRAVKNAEDLYLSLVWHKFGNAVLLAGCVKETDAKSGLFCLAVDGKREQWCRFRDPAENGLPEVGASVELFGWEKWNTHIVEVLELTIPSE